MTLCSHLVGVLERTFPDTATMEGRILLSKSSNCATIQSNLENMIKNHSERIDEAFYCVIASSICFSNLLVPLLVCKKPASTWSDIHSSRNHYSHNWQVCSKQAHLNLSTRKPPQPWRSPLALVWHKKLINFSSLSFCVTFCFCHISSSLKRSQIRNISL